MNTSHLNVTQAGVTSLLVAIVGQVVAFVPSLANSQQVLVSAGSFGIAVAFLIANAVHHLASSRAPVTQLDVRREVDTILRGVVQAGLDAQASSPQPPPAAVTTAQPPPPPAAGGPA